MGSISGKRRHDSIVPMPSRRHPVAHGAALHMRDHATRERQALRLKSGTLNNARHVLRGPGGTHDRPRPHAAYVLRSQHVLRSPARPEFAFAARALVRTRGNRNQRTPDDTHTPRQSVVHVAHPPPSQKLRGQGAGHAMRYVVQTRASTNQERFNWRFCTYLLSMHF